MAENTSTPTRSFPDLPRRPSFIGRNVNQPIEEFLSFFRNRYNQSYCEGAFEVGVPAIPYEVTGGGTPNFKYKSLQYYRSLLCDWCYSIPESAQWVVFVQPHNSNYLYNEITKMKEYEPHSVDDDWDNSELVKKLTSGEAQDVIGCVFCLGVTEAGGSINIENHGGVNGNNVGLLKSPVVSNRADNEPLQMVFRESNCSYSQNVLNPWRILVGHKGLHARPKSESIKADITVFQLGQTDGGFNSNVIRKCIVYHDCVPISLNSLELDYETKKLIQRNVEWSYNYYTVRNMNNFEILDN